MLYLCLSLIAFVCVSTRSKSSQYPLFVYFVSGLLCGSKSPISLVNVRVRDNEKIHLLFTCQTHPVTKMTFCRLCGAFNEVVVVVHLAAGCPTFKHFACFCDWPRGAVTQLPSSSNTRIRTSTRCRANTGQNHTQPLL